MTLKNIFDEIPSHLENELFQTLATSETVTIERIVSRGHSSPVSQWYDQDKNEWVIVLKGSALLIFEDESTVTLKKGDFIDIPAHTKHKVAWTEPNEETVWLAVHYM